MRDQLDTYWNRALAGFQEAVASPDGTEELDPEQEQS
jgi:hypothetical protein